MKTRKIGVIFATILLGVFCLSILLSVQASATTHAFNTATGALNVDYAGYLSKHDVVVNGMITDPKDGLTVGNGRIGAMVSNENGLTMQIQGVDNSEHTCFSSGLVNLYTNPGMDAGYSTYQQRLNLYDGIITVKYDSNRTVTVMGAPNSEVLGIHVEDSRSGVSNVTLDLSIWDVSGLPSSSNSMFLDVPDMNTWKTVSTYNDSNGAGISRGQTDSNHFGYTLAASVEGASYTTSVVDGRKVRLTITPTSSYTIWIANATRINAANNDSVTGAKNLLTSVKSTGYSTTFANFKTWWHNFWSKSFVQYSNNGDADYLENAYYLYNYMIAAGAYANYPNQFINGAFSGVKDADYGKWSGAYWYWNQRDVYNSFWASNHADVMDSFLNLYSRNFNTLKSYTNTKYGIDGIWVPETMGFDGNARHTDESDYTKNVLSTGAEVALNMYLKYKYTNDSTYLSNTAYPFMKEVCKFYTSKLSYDSGAGKYYMASSNAHETYWNVKNAMTDLAAVKALFPITIQVSTALNLDSSLRSQWQNIVNNLVAFPNDGSKYLPCESVPGSNNNENVACEVIWPYSVAGIGDSMAANTWNNRPFPYGNVWSPDAIQAARLGMGDNAYSGMKTMLQNYQNLPNGRTTNSNGEFEYIGVHLAAMNEALLHSYNDKIRVFPAISSGLTAKFTLLASGGFLVSSEMENNEIKYVGIKSMYGNTATVINPWGTQQVQVRRSSDNTILLTTSSSEFNFATAANTVYVIERTAKLLSSYIYEQLSGTANQNVKSLSGTNCKLGTGTGGDIVTITTFYQDTGYGGSGVSLNPGSYTTSQLTATGIQDNWASSVKVPPGYTVEIFDQDNFTGTKWTFTASNADFLAAGCNDAMSSVKIIASSATPTPTPTTQRVTATPTSRPTPTSLPTATPTPTRLGVSPTPTPGPGSNVTFYQNTGFGGTAVSLSPGNYTTAQLSAAGIPDNWVSSVKVPAGYTVEIYDQDNFGGTKWSFTTDNSDFVAAGCNDKMSSVKIIGGSNPTPTPTRTGLTPTPTRPGVPTPTLRNTPTNTPTPTSRMISTPTPTANGSYVVTYVISSDWGSGGNVDVTIKNNTTPTVNGWTLTFSFPGNQTITNLWNGTYTQSGASVSVKDAGYNATITANGGTVNFGFGMTYTGTNGKPTSFTLNGVACQVQ